MKRSKYIPTRIRHLLARWLERRSTVLHTMRLPEYRSTVGMRLRGKHDVWFVPQVWGCCHERATVKRGHDDVDEFGCCLTRMSDGEQELIVNDFLLKGEEWTIWLKTYGGPRRIFEQSIELAWLNLALLAKRAGLI